MNVAPLSRLHSRPTCPPRSPASRRAARRAARRAEHGFTLVELAVVVAIVGILAVLAVVGYRRLITTSHLSEATGLVNGIRVAQESYHAETGIYATMGSATSINWPGTTGTSVCPANNTTPGAFKTGWDPSCGTGNQGPWKNLPLHVDSAVMYGYATISNTISATTQTSVPVPVVQGTAITATAPSGEWYIVSAVGDPDGDGLKSAVLGTSITNQLLIQGEGN